MYNYFTIKYRPIRSWQLNLLDLLAPNGWKPPASRTSANNGGPAVGISRPCEPVSPEGITAFGKYFVPGMGSYIPRVPVASRTPDLVPHTVRGGIDPGSHRFRPRFVGVEDVLNVLLFGHRALCSPGGTGSTNPTLEFLHLAGRYRPGGSSISSLAFWSCRDME